MNELVSQEEVDDLLRWSSQKSSVDTFLSAKQTRREQVVFVRPETIVELKMMRDAVQSWKYEKCSVCGWSVNHFSHDKNSYDPVLLAKAFCRPPKEPFHKFMPSGRFTVYGLGNFSLKRGEGNRGEMT